MKVTWAPLEPFSKEQKKTVSVCVRVWISSDGISLKDVLLHRFVYPLLHLLGEMRKRSLFFLFKLNLSVGWEKALKC